jgi:hypothetical protein
VGIVDYEKISAVDHRVLVEHHPVVHDADGLCTAVLTPARQWNGTAGTLEALDRHP